MNDRPMTYMEREEQLQLISKRLAELVGQMQDRDEEVPDELAHITSALDYVVRHDAGHLDLPPLDAGRPILLPVPAIFVENHPPVLQIPMLSVEDPNAPQEAPRVEREIGTVRTSAGQTNDYILLQWKHVKANIYGRDLLRAWLSTFSPIEAGLIPWSPASQDTPQ